MIDFDGAFDKVWAALDADEDITALMMRGTKYRWLGGLLQRLEITPAMCPILSLGPGGEFALAYDHHEGEPTFPLMCEIATEGQDCRTGLKLLAAVARRLRDQADSDRFDQQDLDRVAFGAVSMDPHPGRDAANPLWVATFRVNLVFRVGTDF